MVLLKLPFSLNAPQNNIFCLPKDPGQRSSVKVIYSQQYPIYLSNTSGLKSASRIVSFCSILPRFIILQHENHKAFYEQSEIPFFSTKTQYCNNIFLLAICL